MALDTLAGGTAFLLARVLFGGVLAFMGLNHFLDTEGMTEYAAYKGLPAPKFGVLASGVLLVAGGFGVVDATNEVILITYLDVVAKIVFGFIAFNSRRALDELPDLDALQGWAN